MYTYEYPRPSVTADCIVFGYREGELYVLLIERGNEPFKGKWALPGGFVDENESCEAAAVRELKEETGIGNIPTMEQFHTFSTPGRDPRGHTIAVAFFVLVRCDDYHPQGSDDASNAVWFRISSVPELAFDHEQILATALKALRKKANTEPLGLGILPEKFSLSDLHMFYQALFGAEIRKEKFASVMTTAGFIEKAEADGDLYSFHLQNYEQLKSQGIYLNFP